MKILAHEYRRHQQRRPPLLQARPRPFRHKSRQRRFPSPRVKTRPPQVGIKTRPPQILRVHNRAVPPDRFNKLPAQRAPPSIQTLLSAPDGGTASSGTSPRGHRRAEGTARRRRRQHRRRRGRHHRRRERSRERASSPFGAASVDWPVEFRVVGDPKMALGSFADLVALIWAEPGRGRGLGDERVDLLGPGKKEGEKNKILTTPEGSVSLPIWTLRGREPDCTTSKPSESHSRSSKSRRNVARECQLVRCI